MGVMSHFPVTAPAKYFREWMHTSLVDGEILPVDCSANTLEAILKGLYATVGREGFEEWNSIHASRVVRCLPSNALGHAFLALSLLFLAGLTKLDTELANYMLQR